MPERAISESELASAIDHSLLVPTALPAEIDRLCEAADRHQFASVCVLPSYVKQAVERLHHRQPAVSTVIGFPLGAAMPGVKHYEAMTAVEAGATELDVVINLGWLKAGESDRVHAEIAQIVEETGQTIKAILETAVLSEAEKRLAGEICVDAGVAFLKTSTGMRGGATPEDVRLLWQLTQGGVAVKASGGIKTLAQAIALLDAGATRLGTSRGVELIEQLDAATREQL
ncbi:MAG: deoxyribose-phosphate aldolase [Cyanobacteria bacterium J06642_2]